MTDRFIDRFVLWAIPGWITPNHITLVRIIATVPTVFLLIGEYYTVAVPLFLATASTDAIDGALARTRNKITEWGMMFDPVADKLLIIPVLLILLLRNLPIPLSFTIISLELLVVLLALVWRGRGGQIQANLWGKIKMILQVTGVFMLLLDVWLSLPLSVFASIVLGMSIYFSIMSMVNHGA
jgi:CDP-diacylglycerol--glycerol-3-phosphate 3-phosphatidyltransferase